MHGGCVEVATRAKERGTRMTKLEEQACRKIPRNVCKFSELSARGEAYRITRRLVVICKATYGMAGWEMVGQVGMRARG